MGLSRRNPAHTPAGLSGGSSDGDRALEKFRPTTGNIVGWAGLAAVAFAVVYCAFNVHTPAGLRVSLGAVLAGEVVWVTQLRPRATAYPRHLHMKGLLRDAHLPYVLIDEVTMGQTLNVWVGDQRYVCVGIGKSMQTDLRQRAKNARQGSLLGKGRYREFAEKADMAAPDQTAMSYHTFVVTRIEELVDQAKRELRFRGGSAEGASVTQPYAVLEIVTLATTALAFVLSLVL